MIRIEFIKNGSRSFLETRDLLASISSIEELDTKYIDKTTINIVKSFIASLIDTIEFTTDEEADLLRIDTEQAQKLVNEEIEKKIKNEIEIKKALLEEAKEEAKKDKKIMPEEASKDEEKSA